MNKIRLLLFLTLLARAAAEDPATPAGYAAPAASLAPAVPAAADAGGFASPPSLPSSSPAFPSSPSPAPGGAQLPGAADPDAPPPEDEGGNASAMKPAEIERRAAQRMEEMLGKMQAAVEEIAEAYGNPTFLQVFTNDEGKADELRERLASAKSTGEIRTELKRLRGERENLLGDIALRERESRRLAARIGRERSALDALAAALEQARKAAEGSTP